MKHLRVVQPEGGDNAEAFDPELHEFRWTCNGLLFEVVPLRWTDDASYAAHQAEDLW